MSVCSGIEAASVAWHPLGWKPLAFSEIEPFPSAVLAHHWPDVPNLGDMTKHHEWPNTLRPQLIVGGTPCQAFSVAGLRKGLEDPRGNLTLVFLGILAQFRPRWVVWENVPGVLSDKTGAFGAFLGGLGELGYGFAYRVLDAQYFGVPQRRRRVFVVGCLGDWKRAASVLFEPNCLRGDSPPSKEARKGTTYDIAPCIAASGRGFERTGDTRGQDCLIPEIAGCLTSRDSKGADSDTKPGHLIPVAFSCKDHGADAGEIAPTLRSMNHDGSHANGGGQVAVAFERRMVHTTGGQPQENLSHCLRADANTGDGAPCVAFAQNQRDEVRTMEVAGALAAEPGMKQQTYIAVDKNNPCYNKVSSYDSMHGTTQERNTDKTLRLLRHEIGEKAFAQWGLGILDSFQQEKVLREALHGEGLRFPTFSRCWMVCCALGSPFSSSNGAMQSVREAIGDGCASQGWELPEQLCRELGAYLSELSQPGTSATKIMHDLWRADEGSRILRKALSAIQKVGRPINNQRQSVLQSENGTRIESSEDLLSGGMLQQSSFQGNVRETCATSSEILYAARRLTCTECEFLQGFPRNHTLIPWRNKPADQCPDGPRYKALGNSMAVPVMRWIGERIG